MVAYKQLLQASLTPQGKVDVVNLIDLLKDAWLADYYAASKHDPNVMEFDDHGFTFMYDQTSATGQSVEDRLVAGFGYSRISSEKRDAGRIQGLLGGGLKINGKGTFDKGHVLAHSAGGGMDVNLFPQNVALNRGRSPSGRLYRQMETYAASNPGTMVFSYLKYGDETWVPVSLQYGVLKEGKTLWIEEFANFST